MDVAVIVIGVVSAAAVVSGILAGFTAASNGAMMSASSAVTHLGRGVRNFAGPDSKPSHVHVDFPVDLLQRTDLRMSRLPFQQVSGAASFGTFIFSVQRFVSSSGTASTARAETAWGGAQIGLFIGDSDSIEGGGGDENAFSEAANALTSGIPLCPSVSELARVQTLLMLLRNLVIVLASTFVLEVFIYQLWKRKVNRQWYRERAMKADEVMGTRVVGKQVRALARFRPFPSVFILPGLPTLILNLFAIGLCKCAVEVIVTAPACCGLKCFWPAVVILGVISAHLLLAGYLVHRFCKRFREPTWRPLQPAAHAQDVNDPFYRWISRLRTRACRKRTRSCMTLQEAVIERTRGTFEFDLAEMREPQRTERLLARPFALCPEMASDSYDAFNFVWFYHASGGSVHGMFFDFFCLVVMLLLASIQGLGVVLTPRTPEAMAQVSVIAAIQLSFSLYLYCCGASNDRMDQHMVATMFLLEGLSTSMQLIFDVNGEIQGTQKNVRVLSAISSPLVQASFLCAICALLLPALLKLYSLFVYCTRANVALVGEPSGEPSGSGEAKSTDTVTDVDISLSSTSLTTSSEPVNNIQIQVDLLTAGGRERPRVLPELPSGWPPQKLEVVRTSLRSYQSNGIAPTPLPLEASFQAGPAFKATRAIHSRRQHSISSNTPSSNHISQMQGDNLVESPSLKESIRNQQAWVLANEHAAIDVDKHARRVPIVSSTTRRYTNILEEPESSKAKTKPRRVFHRDRAQIQS